VCLRERERLGETMTINEMRDLSEMWGGGWTGNLKKRKGRQKDSYRDN